MSLLDSVGASGDQAIATILKHDNKTTSYKIALLRALNDLVLSYPGLASTPSFAVDLARHTVGFINKVSAARYVTRF